MIAHLNNAENGLRNRIQPVASSVLRFSADLQQEDGVKLLAQWRQSVDRLLEQLARLPLLTEGRFLEVGTKLRKLTELLRDIEEKASTAGGIMADETTLLSIRELEQMLVRMESRFQEADQRASVAGAVFAGIFLEMKAVCRLMENFKGHVGQLRMLKTLTNIQSAGHSKHGAGFRNVAANIGELSFNIQSKSNGILARITHLQTGLEKAMEMVASLGKIQKQLGCEVVAATRQQVSSLAEIHGKCASAAQDVSGRSAKIFRDVQEIVVSLQFQDITRQQMEHVHEALAALRTSLENNDIQVAEAARLCALQSAQLSHSGDELLAAVARIVLSLNSVACEAAMTTKEAHGLFQLTDRMDHSSLGDIETGLRSIADAFAENIATSEQLIDIMRTVANDLGEINAFAADIDYLGSEIRLIALNAIIMAAQAGESGAAFSVIAGTVKQQSEDICRQAAAISRSIHAITSHVAELQSDLETGDIREAKSAGARMQGEELVATVGRLHEITDTVTGLLAKSDAVSGQLALVINDLLAALDDREIVRILKGEAIPSLERLALTLGKASGTMAPANEGIEKMQGRYTMQSERDIHRMFAALPRSVADERPSAPADGYFGDNVEFF
jgi:hypothetical protein